MNKQALKELYGTADVATIIKNKSTLRQDKVFNTEAPSVVTMTADQCKALCDKLGKEYLPGYEGRVLRYITTNEVTDRYGDIVRATGASLTNYMKNPVVMFAHQHDNFPVGCSLNIFVDPMNKNIPADALFLDERVDSSGRSDLVFKFAKSKFMPACSIGLMPTGVNNPMNKAEREAIGLGDYGVEFTSWEYLEFSPCSIPANPDALQLAIKSCDLSVFQKEDIDLVAKNAFLVGNLLDRFAEEVKAQTKGGPGSGRYPAGSGGGDKPTGHSARVTDSLNKFAANPNADTLRGVHSKVTEAIEYYGGKSDSGDADVKTTCDKAVKEYKTALKEVESVSVDQDTGDINNRGDKERVQETVSFAVMASKDADEAITKYEGKSFVPKEVLPCPECGNNPCTCEPEVPEITIADIQTIMDSIFISISARFDKLETMVNNLSETLPPGNTSGGQNTEKDIYAALDNFRNKLNSKTK